MGCDDEQEPKAAQSVECRWMAGRQVILVAQFGGSTGGWHAQSCSAMTVDGYSRVMRGRVRRIHKKKSPPIAGGPSRFQAPEIQAPEIQAPGNQSGRRNARYSPE